MTYTDKFYTPEEVARILKLNKETVRRKLRSGELKAFKAGKVWRIPSESLKEYQGQKRG